MMRDYAPDLCAFVLGFCVCLMVYKMWFEGSRAEVQLAQQQTQQAQKELAEVKKKLAEAEQKLKAQAGKPISIDTLPTGHWEICKESKRQAIVERKTYNPFEPDIRVIYSYFEIPPRFDTANGVFNNNPDLRPSSETR